MRRVIGRINQIFSAPVTQHPLRAIILLVIVWRLGLTLLANFSISHYPYTPSFPYYNSLLKHLGGRSLTTWAQFDGVHYLYIITRGYWGTEHIQAFFPLYPQTVKLLSFHVINPILMGIIVSTLCFTAGLFTLFKLICLDHSSDVAWKTILLIIFCPVSYYFTAVYSEGLFFLLIILSLYAARTHHWFLAGMVGALATATRIIGFAIVPALIFEFCLQHKKIDKSFFFTLIPSLGALAYMFYLQLVFHDGLLFYHSQDKFGTARDISRLIFLPQVFYRYFHMLITTSVHNPIFINLVSEMGSAFLGTAALIVGWFRIRKSYIIFSIIGFLLPTLTGTFTGLPRYLLPLFPIPLLIATHLRSRWAFTTLLIASIICLIFNTILFTQGIWVA